MHKCLECGVEDYNVNYSDSEQKEIMFELDICFSCAFWINLIRKQNPRCAIIDGSHYYIGAKLSGDESKSLAGYGGATFFIKFNKGDGLVRTSNLWHQGEIPSHFVGRLPDNAQFFRNKEAH